MQLSTGLLDEIVELANLNGTEMSLDYSWLRPLLLLQTMDSCGDSTGPDFPRSAIEFCF